MWGIINPVKIIVAIVCLYGWLQLDRNRPENRYLLSLLTLVFLTEAVNSVLIINNISLVSSITTSIILHQLLWLMLFRTVSARKGLISFLISTFLAFSIVNLLLVEGARCFNYYTFVFGAILYLLAYTVETAHHFRVENLEFFQSREFLLISSPVIFLSVLSLMFSFRSFELNATKIIYNISLYELIIHIVNLIYYSLLALYIRSEKKKVYA